MINNIIKKHYPFWLGLISCIFIIGITKEFSSIGVFLAYLIGYFKLTKFHKDDK